MKREEVDKAVIIEIAGVTGDLAEEILPETNMREDLGLDSLDSVELCLYLEEQFNIEIPDSAFDKVVKVSDLQDEIWTLIQKKV